MPKTYYVAYVHNVFDEEEFLTIEERPSHQEAASHSAAAMTRAKILSEGSRNDGLLVFGPMESFPTFKLFRLIPPKKFWTVEEAPK